MSMWTTSKCVSGVGKEERGGNRVFLHLSSLALYMQDRVQRLISELIPGQMKREVISF